MAWNLEETLRRHLKAQGVLGRELKQVPSLAAALKDFVKKATAAGQTALDQDDLLNVVRTWLGKPGVTSKVKLDPELVAVALEQSLEASPEIQGSLQGMRSSLKGMANRLRSTAMLEGTGRAGMGQYWDQLKGWGQKPVGSVLGGGKLRGMAGKLGGLGGFLGGMAAVELGAAPFEIMQERGAAARGRQVEDTRLEMLERAAGGAEGAMATATEESLVDAQLEQTQRELLMRMARRVGIGVDSEEVI